MLKLFCNKHYQVVYSYNKFCQGIHVRVLWMKKQQHNIEVTIYAFCPWKFFYFCTEVNWSFFWSKRFYMGTK